MPEEAEHTNDVAIVGMSGRFPGAKNVDELWQNLCDGVECISFFSRQELEESGIDPALLDNPSYVRVKGVLENADLFDASFFGYSPREAQIMDLQQRIFLECAWEALENAGYDSDRYAGRIGVYGGAGWNTYLLLNLFANRDLVETVGDLQTFCHGNDKDYLTSRVSYKLNLTGPSINVQTACSTSLVAVCVAYQSLLNGECDMALAGGVFVTVPLKAGYLYFEGGILSPDGHCRAFDAKAGGTVFGDGVGIVVLKRLADALADGDHIYAVIKGSAVNNDGSSKVSYTAPSVDGQAKVISEAIAMAGIDAETITYVETHGTGTSMGDLIELAGLVQAFGGSRKAKASCAIGSVKTNIGHLDAAAGVAGAIKTALALKHKRLPPSLNFEQPNPRANLENSPFYVNTELTDWKAGETPRRAVVSSFGVGGTNANVVFEEAPALEQSSGSFRPFQLLMLSAKTDTALEAASAGLAEHLRRHPETNLVDAAYTLQVGRKRFNHRRAIVCQGTGDAITLLESPDPKRVFSSKQEPGYRPVVFMFSGQGAQYVNMGFDLYCTERIFREQIDRCAEFLKPLLGLDLREVLYPRDDWALEAESLLNQTAITQPVIFVIEYALSRLWKEWGVTPQAVIGHSIGEFAAACLADVFCLEEALSLVAARGRLMQSLPAGAMLAVPLPETDVKAFLGPQISMAAVNGPGLCVVSGISEAIDALEKQLATQGTECRRLHTSHAFHSTMMEPIIQQFAERARTVSFRPPQIPYLSSVTGGWITAAEVTNPDYWVRNLRETVRFGDAVQQLFKAPSQMLLEVGPGQTLSTLARQNRNMAADQAVFSSLRHPQDQRSDVAFLLATLGGLWIAGWQVDWSGFYADERRVRLPLPTYPFERKRHWVPAGSRTQPDATRATDPCEEPEDSPVVRQTDQARQREETSDVTLSTPMERSVAVIWKEVLGVEQIRVDDNFFGVGGNSLSAAQVIARLRNAFGVKISLTGFFAKPTIAGLTEMLQQSPSDECASATDLSKKYDARDALQRLGLN